MPRIATLGTEGSFSEEAAAEYGNRFREVKILLMDDLEDIIGLAQGADLGLLAIENSLEGSIALTLDLMKEMKSVICDEVVLRIRHSLVGSSDLGSVGKVFSHPAALAQCRRFLKKKLPHAELVVASSTAQGARLASVEPRSAAIASLRAARIYGLKVLAEDIQDQDTYTTRKVPLLGDIPLLGWLFKSTSSQRTRTNLVIMLTPRIIKTGEDMAEVSRQQRERFDKAAAGDGPFALPAGSGTGP
ncbi:hypothetical protein FDZ71_12965 [bacterium]|nr:MAG: hypothetical protein FDZ71_12965 [bacterium]